MPRVVNSKSLPCYSFRAVFGLGLGVGGYFGVVALFSIGNVELIKFLSLSNPSELSSHHFHSWLCWPVGLSIRMLQWLDGAR